MPGRRHLLHIGLVLCAAFLVTGCSKKKKEIIELSPTPAQTKLVEILSKENEIDVVTKALPNTLWIYAPLEDVLLNTAGSETGPQKSSAGKTEMALQYLDGYWKEGFFNVEFDIGEVKKYTNDKGLATKYSEEYSKVSRAITTAINKAYTHIERKVGTRDYIEKITGDRDYAGEQKNLTHKTLVQSHVLGEHKVPDFIVVVIADIKNGIKTHSLVYLQDLRRAHLDPSFIEEYSKRSINEQPTGHTVIIGDNTGLHLDYHDVTWQEFLMKQIIHRIQYQYQLSSHKPKSNDFSILTELAHQTLRAYPFRDYQGVKFLNLESKKNSTLFTNDVAPYKELEDRDPGRIQNIKIKIDKPKKDGI